MPTVHQGVEGQFDVTLSSFKIANMSKGTKKVGPMAHLILSALNVLAVLGEHRESNGKRLCQGAYCICPNRAQRSSTFGAGTFQGLGCRVLYPDPNGLCLLFHANFTSC